MKQKLCVLAVIASGVSTGGSSMNGLFADTTPSLLPSSATAQRLLNTTTRHREWVTVTTGSSPVPAFVVYPERSDKAPVVLVTIKNEPASVRARAIADQLSVEGFIAIVPDVLTRLGPSHAGGDQLRSYEATQRYAERLPAATGRSVWLNLDPGDARADVVADAGSNPVVRLRATSASWPTVIEHLSRVTGNRPTLLAASRARSIDDHASHAGHAMASAAQNQRTGSTASRLIPGLAEKPPNLPASSLHGNRNAGSIQAEEGVGRHSPRQWHAPHVGGYPEGNGKAGVVIVMQHGVGLDDWMRSVADQLAADGFIAVAPDAWSGTGPTAGTGIRSNSTTRP